MTTSRHEPRDGEIRESWMPYLDGLFTYCLSALGDPGAAAEALGEALAQAGRRADRAPGGAALRPWLYALARWAWLGRCPGPAARPARREAFELAVRHGLAPGEVAAVLRLDPGAARALISGGACEVERARVARAVAERGGCPALARLADAALVRHVDECAACRRTAERATAGSWPGTSVAVPPLVGAPVEELRAAVRRALGGSGPRYDRDGFPRVPRAPRDRAGRRSRLRHRALTTTVVATVVAAPVLALWAACRGAPAGVPDGASAPFEDTGDILAPGRLTVTARQRGEVTLVTLTAVGGEVRWSATADASWLRLSGVGGVLRTGRSTTVTVSAVPGEEQRGWGWGRVVLMPGGSVVRLPQPRPFTVS
ncbi:BACON domain-containing protein [Streptomyces sp. AV19]|uniref:BACON domain-containing protein n=1 Tax=Streptomyces sp. AV19 TaxID=2793068 RepID=UPI0018FE1C78|nr:BACON domain-containing protein [Streptomyces sp. AV19]MBH1934988.1 BACON domain-containing protein [Streptomyces sp. AV19]MDG4534594.1 BACON domain-containing protein [Streptomyces sp. AV19]